MRLRLKESAWTTSTGRRYPGSERRGSARSAHQISPPWISSISTKSPSRWISVGRDATRNPPSRAGANTLHSGALLLHRLAAGSGTPKRPWRTIDFSKPGGGGQQLPPDGKGRRVPRRQSSCFQYNPSYTRSANPTVLGRVVAEVPAASALPQISRV